MTDVKCGDQSCGHPLADRVDPFTMSGYCQACHPDPLPDGTWAPGALGGWHYRKGVADERGRSIAIAQRHLTRFHIDERHYPHEAIRSIIADLESEHIND